jgi:hypothetical protein
MTIRTLRLGGKVYTITQSLDAAMIPVQLVVSIVVVHVIYQHGWVKFGNAQLV